MIAIVGFIIVTACIIVGYTMHHGQLAVLMQINEFIIIGGAAAGSLVISAPLPVLKRVFGSFGTILKGDPYTPTEYMNLLMTIFSLSNVVRREGLISVEAHIEDPEKSTIFSRNEFLMKNHHALHFFCDTLRLLTSGGIPPHELESMLDTDIELHHKESGTISSLIQKTADAFPGLGIVAAVLGIIITMQSINEGAAAVGAKVAAALVGTFLGVLLSYGFVGPLAQNLELLGTAESCYYECIKTGLIAIAKGYSPAIAVEFARRAVPQSARPTFKDSEEAMKAARAQG